MKTSNFEDSYQNVILGIQLYCGNTKMFPCTQFEYYVLTCIKYTQLTHHLRKSPYNSRYDCKKIKFYICIITSHSYHHANMPQNFMGLLQIDESIRVCCHQMYATPFCPYSRYGNEQSFIKCHGAIILLKLLHFRAQCGLDTYVFIGLVLSAR